MKKFPLIHSLPSYRFFLICQVSKSKQYDYFSKMICFPRAIRVLYKGFTDELVLNEALASRGQSVKHCELKEAQM